MTPWSRMEFRRVAASIPAGMPTTSARSMAHSASSSVAEQRQELAQHRLARDHRLAEIAVQHAADINTVLHDDGLVEAVFLEQRRVPRSVDAALARHRLDRIAGHEANQEERATVIPTNVGITSESRVRRNRSIG